MGNTGDITIPPDPRPTQTGPDSGVKFTVFEQNQTPRSPMQRTLRLMDLPANYFWKWHDTQPQKMMHFLITPRVMCTQSCDVTKFDIKDKFSSSEAG